MKKVNEENACNAFIEILKKITGVDYEKESSPDEQSSASPNVDYILISKDGRSHRIAVEHTKVESFGGQIRYFSQSYDVVEAINVQCQGKLPTDRFYFVSVPHSLIGSLTTRRLKEQFVKEMSSWISYIAKNLTIDKSFSRKYANQQVTLMCLGSHPEMNGNVHRAPERPMEPEKLKKERFRRAIKEKLPKLIKNKREKGYTTALLLEDSSGVLMDYQERWKDLAIIQRLLIRMFTDYVIILFSNNQKMIVGNVWKEKGRLYSTIPHHRRFSLHRCKDTTDFGGFCPRTKSLVVRSTARYIPGWPEVRQSHERDTANERAKSNS